MKKIKWTGLKVALISFLILTVVLSLPSLKVLAAKDSTQTEGNQLPYRVLTADEIVTEMGAGWNLGNTMDGHTGFTPSEIIWQNVETTKELIKSVHDMGFNTVRVPVTWGTMIDDENGYAIDEAWISRVQDIVDYCIAQDMYVIINIHHDGAEQSGWLRVAAEDINPVNEKFEGVWRNIAEKFKDYDEHLIFESMNEVTGDDGSTEGATHDTEVIMKLNQIFVDVVRSTGSNNANRWLSVPGRYTNIEKMTSAKFGFDLPKDTVENRLFVSVHYYDYSFGMVQTLGITMFSYNQVVELARSIKLLNDRFTSQGIPVILGEYGCINKDNGVERAYHVEAFTRMCQLNGIVACYWDQGWYDRTMTPDYSFSLVDRTTGKTIDAAVTDAIMRGTYLPALSEDYSDIIKDTTVNTITAITVNKDAITLSLGENEKLTTQVTPSDTNDLVLWKTGDETVATVFGGNLRARGIGTTIITAYSQSGSVEKTIKVTVFAQESKIPATALQTEKAEYELMIDKFLYLNVNLEPSDTDDYVTYKSSNETIASVSSLGKVVAKSVGVSYITMTASNGLTKTVKITVKGNDASNELALALNVYYNDSTIEYFNNEIGENITISGDGQYTLAFDIPTHLSAPGIKAGVTGINNLTAVYIKDYDVIQGNATKSSLAACNIMYDKIVVDGVELVVTQTEPKSAIKSSGIFDTNDPLNAWDGSQVNEVTVTDHVLNIEGMNNPQRIEVTFTISGLVFEGGESQGDVVEVATIEATTIEATTTDTITLSKVGEALEISAIVAPENANSTVTFVSSDESVAYVDATAVTVDSETGIATATIIALSDGAVTITAFTENGLTTTVQVVVDIKADNEQEEVKENTNSDAAEVSADQVDDQAKEGSNSLGTIIIIVIVVVIAIGIGMFVITKKKK